MNSESNHIQTILDHVVKIVQREMKGNYRLFLSLLKIVFVDFSEMNQEVENIAI